MSTGFPAAPEETAEGTLDVLKLLGGMQKFEDKVFEEVATSTKFLPRLQLFSSNSSEVKEDKIRMGHYGLVTMKGQPVIDLTSTVDVLVCVWRPKALDMSDINNVVSIFDVTNPMFVSIASKADDTDSGCMFGIEFLVWVPSVGKFATFFCGSKTARREAINIKGLTGQKVTLKTHLIKKGKHSWHGPRVFECSAPFEMPDVAELRERVNEFNNPPATDVEEAPTGGGEGGRER
jgi:hypothetical protein